MRSFLAVLVLVALVADVSAQSRREQRREERAMRKNGGWQDSTAMVESTVLPTTPTPAGPSLSWRNEETKPVALEKSSASECTDALAEVNAVRAQRGLKPYVNDPELAKAALGAARSRARVLCAGHTQNDFSYLPSGTHAESAGCAAWEPSFGWGSCCTYDSYIYGGAAWVLGSDGRRYMHLFCR